MTKIPLDKIKVSAQSGRDDFNKKSMRLSLLTAVLILSAVLALTAVNAANDFGSVSAYASDIEPTPIPYTLRGGSSSRSYDANGNLIDTSNFLTSIGTPSDVYPAGFDLGDVPYY